MNFTVAFTDISKPPMYPEIAIEVEAASEADAMLPATEIFSKQHPDKKLADFETN